MHFSCVFTCLREKKATDKTETENNKKRSTFLGLGILAVWCVCVCSSVRVCMNLFQHCVCCTHTKSRQKWRFWTNTLYVVGFIVVSYCEILYVVLLRLILDVYTNTLVRMYVTYNVSERVPMDAERLPEMPNRWSQQ